MRHFSGFPCAAIAAKNSLNFPGRVYTYTIVDQPAHPDFQADTPYTYAIVQLDEGVRVPTNIVECAPEDVRVDMPVGAVFDDVSAEWTLVKFKPA